MEAIYTETKNGKTVEIYHDQDSESPRSWSTFGKILYVSNYRYVLGDEEATREEIEEIVNSNDFVSLPVYAYIHGNTVLKAFANNPFSCPWDSGQSGIVYVSKEDIAKEFGDTSEESINKAILLMQGQVDTFSQYLNGEVYGFILKDAEGNQVDSCWGYYDTPEKLAEMVLKGEV